MPLPAVAVVVCRSRSTRAVVGSVGVFLLLGLFAGAMPTTARAGGHAPPTGTVTPDDKPKKGGKLTDDPLPAKPPAGWEEYVQEKFKAYSIWLPKTGRTLEQTEGSVETKSGKIGYVILKCDIDNDIKLNVQRFIIPLAKGEMIDAAVAIETFREMHMEEFPGKITEEYDLMLGKMPGKEFRVDLKDGDKSRVRIYQVGRAVWHIWVTGTKEQVMSKNTNLIFASFKNQILLKDKK